jgi:hypothetical protein
MILVSWSDESSNYEEKSRLDRTKTKFYDINSALTKNEELLQHFYPNASNSSISFAQCKPALARLAVWVTALRNNHQALLDFLLNIIPQDAELAMVSLECIPNAWERVGTLSGLCEAYLVAINSSQSAEVRCIARTKLAELLDRSFSRFDSENEKTFQVLLRMLKNSVPRRHTLPQNLLCAKIRTAGWILMAAFNSISGPDFEAFEEEFKVWGYWLTLGGSASIVRIQCVHCLLNIHSVSNVNRISTCVLLLLLLCIRSIAT